jgi:DNA repair exonuclease SbcCD nuclease subunit
MKICIIGDVHAHKPVIYNHERGNYALSACAEALLFIFDYGKRNGITHYFFVGDIFTIKDRIPNVVKNKLLQIFRYAHEMPSKYIIAGNHDGTGERSSLRIFEPFYTIIDTPQVQMICGKKITCVPFGFSDKFVFDGGDLLLGHFPLQGAQMNAITNLSRTDVHMTGDLSAYTHVVCGHYHSFQRIGHGYVLGSIYQEEWSEAGDKKWFCVYDGIKLDFIRIPDFLDRRIFYIKDYGDIEKAKKRNEPFSFYNKWKVAQVLSRSIDLGVLNEFKTWLLDNGYVSCEFAFDATETSVEFGAVDAVKKQNMKSLFSEYLEKLLCDMTEDNRHLHKTILDTAMGVSL